MNRGKWSMLVSASAAAMLMAGAAQAQSVPPADTDEAHVAEIVVTASKREERLRDVPAAVTALGSDTIDTLGVRDFRDYATLVPGLSQRDFGSPGNGVIIIRGLNTGPQQTTNTAAFYIDDAPFSASGFFSSGALVTPSPDLADVDRIEVLKGPQGTLYGASSLGGLVRVLTKKPDATRVSGMAQVEGESVAHGGEGWSARGALNLPIATDKAAVRLSGFYRKTAGWADNVANGEEDVNSSIIKGGRIALRAMPTERLTLDFSGFYQDIENRGASAQDNINGTTRPLYGKYKASFSPDTGRSDLKYRSLSGTANYDTDAGSIVAVASYVKTKSVTVADYSTLYGDYLSLLGIVPPGTQVIGTIGPNMEKFTAETRFVSDRIGAFEFVVGGFYTHETNSYPNLLIARSPTGVPLPAPFDVVLRSDATTSYEEYAAFANATFYLTDRLDITGGLRYAHNRQKVDGQPNIAFYVPGPAITGKFSDDATTYLATIRYRPTENISLFARAASGYRPGGPQLTRPLPVGAQTQILADTVWNYEAGIKATALDGAFTGSLSVYRIDWKDIQLNSLFGGLTLMGNAGAARVDGLELEMLARPSRNLTIGANVGHTDARITRIDAGAASTLGAAKGDKLPLTPGWTVATYFDQAIPFSDTVKGSLGATLRFQSDMPGHYPGDPINPNVQVPDITTLDLRAGVTFSRFSLWLRAENIFDKLGYTSLTTSALYPGQAVPTSATTIRPRTLLVSATANF